MKKDLERLVQLQYVDSQLQDLEIAKGDLPETVNNLTEKVNSLINIIKENENKNKKAKLEQKNLEGLANLSSDKLKKLQNQLYDVTTNREYDALTNEIETEKSNIEKNETRILELITFEEEIEIEIETKKEEHAAIKKELKEKDSELRKLTRANEEKENLLTHEKEKIVVRINKQILRGYNRIHDYHKNGLAVAPVSRNACGGCFNSIPPQRLVEIRKMDRMIKCEVCGRILVWKDNGSVK